MTTARSNQLFTSKPELSALSYAMATSDGGQYQKDVMATRQKNKILLSQIRELQDEIVTLERERHQLEIDREETLLNSEITMESLDRAKQGLLNDCNNIEEHIRDIRKQKLLEFQ